MFVFHHLAAEYMNLVSRGQGWMADFRRKGRILSEDGEPGMDGKFQTKFRPVSLVVRKKKIVSYVARKKSCRILGRYKVLIVYRFFKKLFFWGGGAI